MDFNTRIQTLSEAGLIYAQAFLGHAYEVQEPLLYDCQQRGMAAVYERTGEEVSKATFKRWEQHLKLGMNLFTTFRSGGRWRVELDVPEGALDQFENFVSEELPIRDVKKVFKDNFSDLKMNVRFRFGTTTKNRAQWNRYWKAYQAGVVDIVFRAPKEEGK